MTPEETGEAREDDDPWLDDEEPDADDDLPEHEDPDDQMSDRFSWFWGEDEGGEESDG